MGKVGVFGAYLGTVGVMVLCGSVVWSLVLVMLADGVSLLLLGLVVLGVRGHTMPGSYVVVQARLSVVLWVGVAVGCGWITVLVLFVKFGACIGVWVYGSL